MVDGSVATTTAEASTTKPTDPGPESAPTSIPAGIDVDELLAADLRTFYRGRR